MSKTVVVLLLVCAASLQDAHASWLQAALEIAGDVGTSVLHTAAKAVVRLAEEYEEDDEKRDAEKGGILSDDVRQQLEESCPVLLGTDKDGEHQDVVHQAVSESDADGDGALSLKEMEAFTQILDGIEICQDFVTLLSADGPQFDGGQP